MGIKWSTGFILLNPGIRYTHVCYNGVLLYCTVAVKKEEEGTIYNLHSRKIVSDFPVEKALNASYIPPSVTANESFNNG